MFFPLLLLDLVQALALHCCSQQALNCPPRIHDIPGQNHLFKTHKATSHSPAHPHYNLFESKTPISNVAQKALQDGLLPKVWASTPTTSKVHPKMKISSFLHSYCPPSCCACSSMFLVNSYLILKIHFKSQPLCEGNPRVVPFSASAELFNPLSSTVHHIVQ